MPHKASLFLSLALLSGIVGLAGLMPGMASLVSLVSLLLFTGALFEDPLQPASWFDPPKERIR